MDIALTRYSHGAGCGCKIAPSVLERIIRRRETAPPFEGLLVGHENRDDAAVRELGDGTAVISTTDFFMPIVDDPEDFGRIAAVNAISDVYAMGGRPMLAIAILGWPVETLPPEVAGRVLDGARDVCASLDVPLAGGHSIDNPEPLFGLAVTGRVEVKHLKRNAGLLGGTIHLTKPLGVGILSTAQKKGLLKPEHATLARDVMVQPNDFGAILGEQPWVAGMTDVTGFGLMGHLGEMCEAAKLSAEVELAAVPFIDRAMLEGYIEAGAVPGGTRRNFESYGDTLGPMDAVQRALLCDPQTSGGLLVCVAAGHQADFEALARARGLHAPPIGRFVQPHATRIALCA